MNFNKRLVVAIMYITLILGSMVGCSSLESTATKKVGEAAISSQINTIKTNQQLVARVIAQEYAEKGTEPTKEEIEEASIKSLAELKINLVFEGGKIIIKNADSRFTTDEIPDLVFDTKKGEIVGQ